MAAKTPGIGFEAIIDTYKNAPKLLISKAEELAAAGFIYAGNGDFKVKCQSCSIVLNLNDMKIVPWETHIRESPTCSYVKIIQKYILKTPVTANKAQKCSVSEALSLAINSFDKATPQLKDRAARFSLAGFIYTGESNKILCQSCGLYNANIEHIVEDDPVIWHGRVDTQCPHQELLKKHTLIEAAGSQDLQAKIRSFETSPPALKNRALDYALAGFFYSGKSNLVHCRSCNIFLQIQKPELCPWLSHSSLRPDCEYVRFVEKSGLVKMLSAQNLIFNMESFEEAPPVIKKMARRFALAGFHYTGISDRVACNTCYIISQKYSPSRDPWHEHRLHNPSCKYVQFLEKHEIVDITSQDMSTKLASFDIAPVSVKNQSGELALAGFHYTGIADNIKCFTCQLILERLPQTFDPFGSHLKFQPECSYIQLLQEYGIIKVVAEINKRTIVQTATVQGTHIPEVPTAPTMGSEKYSGVQNADSAIESLCSICMDGTRDIALIPCGHVSTCSSCASSMNICPICRKAIERTLKIFS